MECETIFKSLTEGHWNHRRKEETGAETIFKELMWGAVGLGVVHLQVLGENKEWLKFSHIW